MERYRSGRNGGASKASCGVTRTGVRIPPSPPSFAHACQRKRELRLGKRVKAPGPATRGPFSCQTGRRERSERRGQSHRDSDGGQLRCPAGANCGLAACGSGLTRADGSVACDGSVVRWPKFGFCALQSATSCPSICGRGLLNPRGRANPRIMGAMQSTNRPSPALAGFVQGGACSHAAVISAQARWRGEVRCSAHY